MLIQGSVVTMIASFMASLGLLNIYYVLILAFLGNFIPDVTLFFLGRSMRKKAVENLISRAGLSKTNLIYLEKNLKKHLKKAIFLIKITPFIPLPGIMLAGFLKIPFKRFFSVSILVDVITIAISALIGFSSGILGLNILRALQLEKYLVPLALIIIILLLWLTKLLYRYLVKNIKKLM